MDVKKNLIKEYITKEECDYMCDEARFDCAHCSCFEDCYMKSCERCNNEFANNIEYGGYNNSEDFWEQL